MQFKRVVVYLSAVLLCTPLSSCLSSTYSQQKPVDIPELELEDIDPVVADRLVEIIDHWHIVIEPDDERYQSAGSIRDEKKELLGSGVLISPLHVLTAAHVACVNDVMFFREHDGEEIEVADVDYPTTDYLGDDIAILHLKEKSNEPPCTDLLGPSDTVKRGDALVVVGNSFDLRKISKPFVFRYHGRTFEDPNVFSILPTYTTIWHGDSGGPIFDMNGRLLGVTVSYRMFRGKPIENQFSSVAYYREWIDSVIQ